MRVPSRLLRDREVVLLQQRPHGHRLVIPVIWAMLAAAGAGAALAAFGTQRLAWIMPAAGLGWFILAGPGVLRWWTTRYVVTTDRLIIRRGWFAGVAADVEWPEVSDVWIDHTLLQRWGGWATVHIDVPDNALALTDVGAPETFRSQCVVAMEVADAISEGADASACNDILDDLAHRGHIASAELAWLRRVVTSMAAR